MIVTFRIRRDTAAHWTATNPVLALGEPGLETDTRRVKYGDGATAWTALGYAAATVAWGQITGTLSNQTDLVAVLAGKVSSARAINTTAPLTGGGDLSADRTLAISPATTTAAGSLSASDKAKLDGIASGATANAGTVTSVSFVNANGITGTITNPTTTPAITLSIDNASVTNAKLANVPTATFKGRTTAGTGSPEDLTATQATALLNSFTSALKGLVPASGGGTATYLRADGTFAAPSNSGGTVTSVTVTTANGVSATVTNPTTTPTLSFTLGAITPSTVAIGTSVASRPFSMETASAGNQPLINLAVPNAVGNNPGIDFSVNAGGTNLPITRIISSYTASGVVGLDFYTYNGTLNKRLSISNVGNVTPAADNTQSLGIASLRFSQLYAGSGTINTSDRDAKKYIGPIPDAWLDAWGDVPKRRFKMKGGGERWHVGYIAQDVHEAFAAHGLDAFDLGLCCYDEWPDEWGEHKNGSPKLITPAGSRWGLRYDECAVMEAAYDDRERNRQRAEIDGLRGQIEALIARLATA